MKNLRKLTYILCSGPVRLAANIIPFGMFLGFSKLVASASLPFLRKRRNNAMRTLSSIPDITKDRIQSVITDGIKGVTLFGFLDAFCDKWNPDLCGKYVIIEGEQNLRSALAKGNGVLLTFVHDNTFNMSLPSISNLKDLYVVAALDKSNHLSRIHSMVRKHFWETAKRLKFIYLGGEAPMIPKIMDILRKGEIISISADGRHARKFFTVPFFSNTKLELAAGPFKLSTMQRAPIVPIFAGFDWTENKFRIWLDTPILSDTPDEAALAFSAQFQEHLRVHPSHWTGWWRVAPEKDENGVEIFRCHSM